MGLGRQRHPKEVRPLKLGPRAGLTKELVLTKALAKPTGDRLQQDTGPEVSLRYKANRLIYDS